MHISLGKLRHVEPFSGMSRLVKEGQGYYDNVNQCDIIWQCVTSFKATSFMLGFSCSEDLQDVRHLAATFGAFAAVCGPSRRVVVWGNKSYGGDAGRVQET
jgi:hypothetical protein